MLMIIKYTVMNTYRTSDNKCSGKERSTLEGRPLNDHPFYLYATMPFLERKCKNTCHA